MSKFKNFGDNKAGGANINCHFDIDRMWPKKKGLSEGVDLSSEQQ